MTATLQQIWRFPIKSHGREALDAVTLTEGQTLPWDRRWAVAHERSDTVGADWAPCQNFSRVSKAPALSAMSAVVDEAAGRVTLSHPGREDLIFDPDTEGARLIAWSKGFVPEARAQSARVVRGRARGFTDSAFPSVTICNMSSHRAVEQRVGKALSIHRWRGNLWFDGDGPWAEFDWIDREVQVGEAVIIPRERTDRCLATHANPETGERDVDILQALDSWGHHDFSVRAEIVRSGRIAVGDAGQAGLMALQFPLVETPDDAALEAARKLFAGDVDFLKGVVAMSGMPADDRIEVCFAGRSNVGKSSLINALTGRKGIARASNTPGRTQEINYFSLGTERYLVDLPGYGFANAPVAVVQKWQALLKAYLAGRASLRRAFVLIDFRHGIKTVDEDILRLLDRSAVTFQVVLTKADKVKDKDQEAVLAQVRKALAKHPAAFPEIIATSSEKGDGIATLRAVIAGLGQDAL